MALFLAPFVYIGEVTANRALFLLSGTTGIV
jgi:hypothetical protein